MLATLIVRELFYDDLEQLDVTIALAQQIFSCAGRF
jgi:hypothetical protein